jgi:hypothetical protein
MKTKLALRRAMKMLGTLVVVSSLFVCVFVSALWIRSFSDVDKFSMLTRRMRMAIYSDTSVINWEYKSPIGDNFSHTEPKLGWDLSESYIPQRGSPAPEGWRLFWWGTGRDLVRDETGPMMEAHQYFLAARDWLVVLIALIAPGIFLIWQLPSMRRRRRIARGQCGDCGYDLRASPDRCPECGVAVEARQAVDRPRAGRFKSCVARVIPSRKACTAALLFGSTVVCTGIATLWYRSYQIGDVFDFLTPKWQIYLLSRSGELQFEHHTVPPQPIRQVFEQRTVWEIEYRHFPSVVPRYVEGGHVLKTIKEVDVADDDGEGHVTNTYVRGVGVRDWALIVLAAAFPTAFLARRLIRFAKRKRRLGAAQG